MRFLAKKMAEFRGIKIRSGIQYSSNYAVDTGSDSESSAQFDDIEETAKELRANYLEKLKSNQAYLDGEKEAWTLNDFELEGKKLKLIVKPTASKIPHKLLHPLIYRNVEKLGTLTDLAKLLDTPDDWEKTFEEKVRGNEMIARMHRDFSELPQDTPETTIQTRFSALVNIVAAFLGVAVAEYRETKIIVGGILAREEYDVRSACDP
jgi:hypothetical protein